MNILLEIDEALMREIMDFSDEELQTFEQAHVYLLKKGLEKVQTVSLDADEVDSLVERLIARALTTAEDKPFLLAAIYKVLSKKPAAEWASLHPTTRKLIGRRFRQAIREYYNDAKTGDLTVEFIEKTAQNSALYRVSQKD
ncbi:MULTISPECIES: hypothetical protein [Pseudomonas]|uniref:hypothetical protein n=1 Tax=Pseudomonas TaxID=286 RepID=UPI000653E4EC|nr:MULTISPECIES: hypothetical protein [Pseudomonas]KMM80539.1 hypothetical protein TU74_22815 [Pseudomonas lundensis]MBJ2293853.1 hypothetical protein [Pseudomonas sp. MF5691]OZY34906.1 hypothetical protein CJF35_22090 [Pseudomonas lundensis]PAA00658.1 hypothetical protein CJU78_24540 [Pseudomonas fragi]